MQSAVSELLRGSRILFLAIAILSLAGIIDSSVALQRHFAKSPTAYCDFSQKFNCDIVNRSEYSAIMDIPVALIGVLGYAALLVLSTVHRSRPESVSRILLVAFAGVAFALYLTYVEAFVLTTWCILCLISLGSICSIAALAVVLKMRSAQV